MSEKQIIKKALAEIEMAETLSSQATKFFYSARKRLEGIYSPTAPKKGVDRATIAKIISKRNSRIQN